MDLISQAARRYELPPRRVLLDTNVVITGALMRSSFAGQLEIAKGEITYVITEYILREAERVVRSAAEETMIGEAAVRTIGNFVTLLGAVVIPEGSTIDASAVRDEDDRPVYAAALHNSCDTICTYNLADFPESADVRVRSPLALLQQLGPGKGYMMLQYPILDEDGTIFIQGRLHHETAMGEILVAQNGTRVFNDPRGYVQVTGPDVSRAKLRHRLAGDEWISFFFRYRRSGHLEAVMWMPDYTRPKPGGGVETRKVVLTEGTARIQPPVTPKLVFNGNFGFFGAVSNISGIPLYVRDRQVPTVIRNRSLECVIGSIDVRKLLARCEFYRLASGEMFVGFPNR